MVAEGLMDPVVIFGCLVSAGFMDLGSDTKELFQLAKIRSGGGSMGGTKNGLGTFFFPEIWGRYFFFLCWMVLDIFMVYTYIYNYIFFT